MLNDRLGMSLTFASTWTQSVCSQCKDTTTYDQLPLLSASSPSYSGILQIQENHQEDVNGCGYEMIPVQFVGLPKRVERFGESVYFFAFVLSNRFPSYSCPFICFLVPFSFVTIQSKKLVELPL